MVDNLARLLVRNNFRVEGESPIFHDHQTLRTGDFRMKQGYIDLIAHGKDQKIAIEFDSGTSLKYKSIEKLLQCDADVLLGIVKGRSRSHNSPEALLGYNRRKILDVMHGLRVYSKKLLLIIMSEKISEEISCGAML